KVVSDFGNGAHVLMHLIEDGGGVFKRSSRWALDHDDDVALVLVGHKRGGDGAVDEVGCTQTGKKQDHRSEPVVEDTPQSDTVSVGYRGDGLVDLPERPILPPVNLAEQNRGQSGREGERVEGRNRDGEGDGQGELAEQNSGGAGEE